MGRNLKNNRHLLLQLDGGIITSILEHLIPLRIGYNSRKIASISEPRQNVAIRHITFLFYVSIHPCPSLGQRNRSSDLKSDTLSENRIYCKL